MNYKCCFSSDTSSFHPFVSFFFLLLPFVSLGSSQGLEILDGTVFKIPLDTYELQTRVADEGTRSEVYTETFARGAEVGINGGFFCPDESAYTRCGRDNSTANERIVNGQEYSKYPTDTGVRGIFGVNHSGQALFVQDSRGYIAGYMRNTNAEKRSDFAYGIANFPILLDQGYDPIAAGAYQEHLDAKMTRPMQRAFICSNQSGDTIYLGYVPHKTVAQMPAYLKERYGCRYALNLDAGKSAALVYRNEHLIGPGRKVTDGFIAVPKQWRIDKQLKEYVMTKKEATQVYVLYKILSRLIDKHGESKRQEIIRVIEIFEQQPNIRANIPKRMMRRSLRTMLSGEYGFKPIK